MTLMYANVLQRWKKTFNKIVVIGDLTNNQKHKYIHIYKVGVAAQSKLWVRVELMVW